MLAQTMNRLKMNNSSSCRQLVPSRPSVNSKDDSAIYKLQTSPSSNLLRPNQTPQKMIGFTSTINNISANHQRRQKLSLSREPSTANREDSSAKKAPIETIGREWRQKQFKTIRTSITSNDRLVSANTSSAQNLLRTAVTITPFNPGSSTDRVQLNKDRNSLLIAPKKDVIEIQTLKHKVSTMFSQKLELELRLTRSLEENKVVRDENESLKKEIEEWKSRQNESEDGSKSEYIVQLLEEYQNTKKIIENLITDNQKLSKMNDQLKLNITRTTVKEDSSLKSTVRALEQQKHQLISKINSLKSLHNTSTQQDQIKSNIIKQSSQELELVKGNLIQKQKEVEHLKEELVQMNTKMKEVVSEISHFSQVFEVEKHTLRKQYQEYKLYATKQIQQLRSMIPHPPSIFTHNASATNILIQDRDSLANLFAHGPHHSEIHP